MNFTADEKQTIKRQIIEALRNEPEIDRIVVFGSFVHLSRPALLGNGIPGSLATAMGAVEAAR